MFFKIFFQLFLCIFVIFLRFSSIIFFFFLIFENPQNSQKQATYTCTENANQVALAQHESAAASFHRRKTHLCTRFRIGFFSPDFFRLFRNISFGFFWYFFNFLFIHLFSL